MDWNYEKSLFQASKWQRLHPLTLPGDRQIIETSLTLSLLLHFPEYIIRDFWILNARFGPLYQTSWLLIPFCLVKVCNARHPMMHIGSSCHGQALNLAQVGCTILPLFFVKKHELVFWIDGLHSKFPMTWTYLVWEALI